MLTLRLAPDLASRLDHLAKSTGRSKSFYVREALEEHLADLEDAYLAEAAYERFLRSGEDAISLDDMEKRLGLAD